MERAEATLRSLTEEILKSNEIEGEKLDREQVRSSIARRLGMDIGALAPADRNVEGVVDMMLDATQKYSEPLTKARLLGWQASLFPTGYSGLNKVTIGAWRKDTGGPMRVVSGPFGRVKEMSAFLRWFDAADNTDFDEGRHRAFVVCDDSSVRRWQRAHRASAYRPHARAIGAEFAALL